MTAEKFAEILDKHKKWLNNEADGERADLSGANLGGTNLSNADLGGANLGYADLSNADLSGANLGYADLSGTNLGYADLGGAKELLSAVNFIDAHFERVEEGYIAYKTFNAVYDSPATWEIEKGAVLIENVNFDRCQECGCGINVAPLEWGSVNIQTGRYGNCLSAGNGSRAYAYHTTRTGKSVVKEWNC